MVPLHLLQIFTQLQSPETRKSGLDALAAYTGAAEAALFGRDPEINIFLPALGLPQTLRHGGKWHAFIKESVKASFYTGQLPSQYSEEDKTALAVADKFGSAVLVFLGTELPAPITEQIAALLPLIGSKLVLERTAMAASAHAAAARDANRHASSLNTALDASRRELQKALERVEQELISRREAETKLKEADRKKDEFLAMLAHELRNPLAPINMAASILKLPAVGKDQAYKASEIIERQVKHMSSLLDDLLDVSRVTRRLIVLEQDVIDLKDTISDALEQTRPLIEAKGHRLTVDMPSYPVTVEGDRTRLVQIVANLLNNAAKYTPAQGKIRLRMHVVNKDVELSIQDNGIGIEEPLLPQVFELFTQAERTSDRTQGGLGLGLALVKSLVELHGGTVEAVSEGLGKGSEFIVRLPLLMSDDVGSQEEGAAVDAGLNYVKPSILVVDDNVDAAQTLAMYLQAIGHEVLIEYSPQRAIERTKSARPKVCILDIGLPEMDGNELARRLRSIPGMVDAVLVAVTGYGQEQDRHNTMEAGFDHHLVKPVDIKRLAEILGDIN
jgi:signal transduction histidine kinase/CheY-like chemotaxis protein